jgi:hypothetical protein
MPAGRKSFEPTEQQRRNVETLAGYGLKQDAIARMLQVDPKTLRKHFRHELDGGADKANAQVAGTLFRMAVSGDCVAATIFWLKTHLNWREKRAGTDGEVLSIPAVRAILAQAALSRPKEDDDELPLTE